MRNYDFVFPHYIHEVLTHREGDKVTHTENEYTKKTIDNPNSWWKGWGAYIVVKFPFLFENQVFNCGNQSRIWGEKFFLYINFDGKMMEFKMTSIVGN